MYEREKRTAVRRDLFVRAVLLELREVWYGCAPMDIY